VLDFTHSTLLDSFYVGATWAMACFATNVYLAITRVITIGLEVIVLANIGTVAFGTSGVPVMIRTGPMKRVGMTNEFIGIKVIPALPSFSLRPRIPRNCKCLKPAAFEGNEVLL
jgi:hypothetical protein